MHNGDIRHLADYDSWTPALLVLLAAKVQRKNE